MSDLDKAFSQYLIDKETPPPPPASETTDENDMSFGDYLDQVTTTIGDIPDMAVRGALRGLGETAFTLGIVDEPQIEKYRKAMDASSKLAVTEGSNPIVSSLGEGVSQIGVTALPSFRALRAMGMGRTTSGIIAEAVGGAVSVNPDDPNLGNLAQTLMGEDRSGPFADAMDILATNPEDPAIMNRARNAIQDSTIGLAFEGLIRSPGAARAMVDRWKSGRSAIPFGEMRENIAEAGARADERLKSTMSGSTLSANPVGAMGDMAVSAAGRLARTDDETAPVFFSAVSNAVDALPMEKGGGDQMRAMIAKGEGVKAEEMSWIGLDDFLKGKKSVTKQEVRDYVEANQVRIEEVVKGGREIEADDIRSLQEAEARSTMEIYDIEFDADEGGFVTYLYGEPVYDVGGELRLARTEEEARDALYEEALQSARNMPESELLERHGSGYGNSVGPGGLTKFGDYTLPGGENYREVLLRLPERGGPVDERTPIQTAKDLFGDDVESIYDLSPEQQSILQRELDKQYKQGEKRLALNFTGGHMDESNVLAHLRLTDRTGPDGEKILFIEEIQSDWHQKGRKQGYKKETSNLDRELDFVERQLDELAPKSKANKDHIDAGGDRSELPFPDIGRDIENFMDRRSELVSEMAKFKDGVPDAPLKKNWHEMSFRRVARMAAEEGYDRIAWTPGKMQAERYDLSRQVSELRAQKHDDGTVSFGYIPPEGGNRRMLRTFVPDNEIEGLVGKEMAEKIRGQNQEIVDYSGVDLEVGGEGMKGFYDKMLKNYASKWGKKFDSKVGVTNLDNEGYGAEVDGELTEYFATRKQAQDYIDSIPNVDKSRIVESGTGEVWTMPVTKKMKDSVLKKGVPFFGVAGATAMVGQQENNNGN